MEKESIKQQLENVVKTEIAALKSVLDEWCKDNNASELDFGGDLNTLPVIALYNENNEAYNYFVKCIVSEDYEYSLVLNRTDRPFLVDNYQHQHLEHDTWAFIPGELTRLTEEVKRAVDPGEPIYHFTDEQKAAINAFNDAFAKLGELKVQTLVDVENKDIHFANGASLGDLFFDGSENYMESGMVEHVADVNADRLLCSPKQYTVDFFYSEGIYLVKGK